MRWRNSADRYGAVVQGSHWLAVLLIVFAWLFGQSLAAETAAVLFLSGVGAVTIAHTRGSPRLYASSVRSTSPSILSAFARRRRRCRKLETLLDRANTSKDVLGDSAYRSAEAEEKLAARGFAAASACAARAGARSPRRRTRRTGRRAGSARA